MCQHRLNATIRTFGLYPLTSYRPDIRVTRLVELMD